jgi:outer membrane lipopolysaccharide assembly protein LptE/RlpB
MSLQRAPGHAACPLSFPPQEGKLWVRGQWRRTELRAKPPCQGLLVLLVVVLAGCGYQLSGQAGTIPVNLQRISVPMFTNATTVPGIEQLVTSAVRTQLQRDGRVRLGTDANSATQLRGQVRRYELLVLTTNRDDFVLEYRVEVEVHVTVEDLQQRQTVLDQTLAVTTEYVVSPQIVPSAIARDRALLALAREAGERVVSLLLDGF